MSDDVISAPTDAPALLPVPATTASSTIAPKKRRWGLGLLILFLLPVGLCAPLCVVAARGNVAVPDAVILELDLEQAIVEGAAAGGLLGGNGPRMSSRDVVLSLQAAAKDPRVKALYARIGGAGHGLATAMEVRDAVLAFKKSGKPTVAFSESFGEMSPGTGGYFIATAFDEVWLQPAGAVSLSPLSGEAMFARDGLAKLGVEPAFAARKEFKNAVNTFTEQDLTAPHKEAMSALLTSAQQAMVEAMVRDRSVLGDAAALTALLNSGPFTDSDALRMHLVDKLGYRDEAMSSVHAKAGATSKLLWLHKYLEREGTAYDDEVNNSGAVVAVITAVGQIHRGTSTNDPLSGTNTVGSDTVAAALRHAVDDKDITAIVLRIDSPGGSVVASETIAHEVQRAHAAGKPVIASMANVAGSGGYYIAMFADVIVAQPGTITGSIGVYAGKMITTKLWQQLGINYETIAVGDVDTSFFSTDMPYSEAARARLDGMVDGIYTSFVTKVASGRHKRFDEVEPVARGRIWSGRDAVARGLVDELGGWPVTLDAVRTALKLPTDAPLRLRDVPAEKPPLALLLSMLKGDGGDSSEDHDGSNAHVAVDVGGMQRVLRAQLAADPVVMLMPTMAVLP